MVPTNLIKFRYNSGFNVKELFSCKWSMDDSRKQDIPTQFNKTKIILRKS